MEGMHSFAIVLYLWILAIFLILLAWDFQFNPFRRYTKKRQKTGSEVQISAALYVCNSTKFETFFEIRLKIVRTFRPKMKEKPNHS